MASPKGSTMTPNPKPLPLPRQYIVSLKGSELKWRVQAETIGQAMSMVCKIVNDNPVFITRLLMTDLEAREAPRMGTIFRSPPPSARRPADERKD